MSTDKPPVRRLRARGINEPITVTLPAHVWLSAITTYERAKWGCPYITTILWEAREVLFDPAYLKELEAEMQRQESQHKHQGLMGLLSLPGFPGDRPPSDEAPPDASGITP
jgi:hypothetical protein